MSPRMKLPELSLPAVNQQLDDIWRQIDFLMSRGTEQPREMKQLVIAPDGPEGSSQRVLRVPKDCSEIAVWDPIAKVWKSVALS